MDALARWVIHHRLIVALFWLAAFIGGAAAAGVVPGRLTTDFSLPGQPGDTAEKALIKQYGVSSFDTTVLTVTVPQGQTVQQQSAKIAQVFGSATRVSAVPRTRVVDYASTGDQKFIVNGGRTTFALVQATPPTSFAVSSGVEFGKALNIAAKRAGFESGTTSYQLLSAGTDQSGGPSVLVETLLGALGALAVLLFVFASFLALMPLIIAAVSILTTFLLVLLLTTFSDVSFVVEFLISLVGLGIAIDYSLLLVSRWREERAHGQSNDEAILTAVRTAGHAVLASGATVAISLVALVVVPVPFLRSMGFGGMLIPLVSVAVVLTLLPAMLSKIGPRVDWPRIRHEGRASRGWTAWARLIVKRRVVAVAAGVVLLALLITPVFGLKIGQSNIASLGKTGPAVQTLGTLRDDGVGGGVLTPITVLVPADQRDKAIAAAGKVDGVQLATGNRTSDGRMAVVDVLPKKETVDSSGVQVVHRVRTAVEKAVDGDVLVAGQGAVVDDYFNAVYDKFPYVLGLIALVTFVLLMRQFRSVLLPIKAVVMNLVSLSAVFGAVTFFWQEGHGSGTVFNIAGTGAITFWLPIIIFAFLFGLSMDYEVFILARMREEYDATGSTSAAVTVGLGRTGRLVTSAALILFFAFAALASSPGTDIKVLGTALGVGILIDATIVRALLVPALVSLFGKYNWWLPGGLAKVLFVEPSPLRNETHAGPREFDETGREIATSR
ncbi:MMPL family transporter [Allobranchiibius huperziae]|uniref:RND superfamily putative drug exporter n=1 Tax=Allobranchiibius huperziae TaxID=1874116 RepID=A0A853DGD4_9MICO|nr:MMPL family transporter [Allobranchiibius huperziae]NYJ75093.1 RND superfamily putative drug exporter [Allobranchiibius huperziae]